MKSKLQITSALAFLSIASFSIAEDGNKKCKKKGLRMDTEKKAEILAEFDTDQDGTLDQEERKVARDTMKKRMMEKYDTDGDNILSDSEKEALRKDMKAKFMKKYDTDGDGELSAEEKKAAIKNRPAGAAKRRKAKKEDQSEF